MFCLIALSICGSHAFNHFTNFREVSNAFPLLFWTLTLQLWDYYLPIEPCDSVLLLCPTVIPLCPTHVSSPSWPVFDHLCFSAVFSSAMMTFEFCAGHWPPPLSDFYTLPSFSTASFISRAFIIAFKNQFS